ncbi:MAG: SpaA isopeptide-forming pilin-related protein [Coprobacillus cateniformis]|uniref:SpaA isopeptide-forming pilin-related protein n=1 Tax=Coprobacillus cateniformis TaxID=100884 RepID=UPI0039A09249
MNKLSKLFKMILSIIIIVSFSLVSIGNVSANNISNSNDYPKQDKIEYNGKITYGSNIVGDFTINGKQAFCMEHPKSTPPTGTKITVSIYDNADIMKVLYYGWGGPEQWSGFENRAHGIVVTSLALSYYYYGDNSSSKTIKNFMEFIEKNKVPSFELEFSKSNVLAFRDGNIQKTESITLKSGSDIFGITINLPDEVTYVNEGNGNRQTGGSLTIKGKTKFHFEAPLNVELDKWNTGEQTKSYNFSPILAKAGGSYQSTGYGEYVEDPSKTTSLTVDWLQLASLELTKTDVYGKLINGAVFRLWNNNDYDKNVTVTNGRIKVDNLTTGIYYLQEKTAPQGFLVDDTIYTITLNAGDSASQTVSNKEPTGKITVVKESENKDRIIGAKFNVVADGKIISAAGKVLYNSGDVVDTLTTDKQGTAVTKNLPLGNYIVYETQAPTGYLLNPERYQVSLRYANQTTPIITSSTTVENKEPLGSIELQKEIESTITDHQLGDAFLSQVEFGLYAREKITNVSGTKVFYNQDELVLKKITDENGHIEWTDLPMGNYYIKELQTNPSMILNPDIIYVSLHYQNQTTSHVTVKTKTSNKIASQRIQIFKEGIKDGEAGTVPGLADAEFTFVLNSEYEKVGFDKAHKYFVGTTDTNGYLTTSLLPYGTYRVKETKTPEGYYGASDFLITIEKDASLYEIGYQIKKVTVNNVPFESLLKVVKKDKETGKTVLLKGATFKVKNVDTNEYVSYIDWSLFPQIIVNQWTTHDDGTITLNTKLKIGHYQLEEIEAPDGYVLTKEPIPFEITMDHYEISSDQVTPITVVQLVDQSVKGKVTIEKKGEVLTDYKDGKFIYEERGLAHAKFGIYAKSDILDPSHDGIVLYKQGELIETLETTEGGKITSHELPLGDYECKELEAPYGYVLNSEVKTFSLSYKGQSVDIVYEDIGITNERQKIVVEVSKKDEETKKYLSGAEISLFANRDIYNYDGDVIVEAGTLLETIVSRQDGKVSFQSDLPLDLTPEYAIMPLSELNDELVGDTNSLYVVKETKQPDGYLLKNVHYYVDGKYTTEKQDTLIFTYDFLNQVTKTQINKVDSETLENIIGAKLQVIDKESHKVIDEWVSEKEGHLVQGLIVGRTYILHEVEAPFGYILAADTEFIIPESREIQSITFMNVKAPVITLGDEPKVNIPQKDIPTEDQTIIFSYLIMGIGACAILFILFKKED